MKKEEFLRLARDRFRVADEAERENREEAAKDLAFLAGDQWDPSVKAERDTLGRPALVFNKLPTFVQSVVNEARQNKPSIKIAPVDSGIDVDTSDVVQGAIRHIEYDSDADVAYTTAEEYAVSCGFGYFRVLTDFESETSFDQEIKIERIEDPFTVYFDPNAKRADRSDARFCFVVTRFSREEFKERWPDSETASTNFFEGQETSEWVAGETVTVAEYWYVEHQTRKLVALSDGRTGFEEDFPKLPEDVTIVRERTVMSPTVKCAKLNGEEILEDAETLGSEWAGKWIPIIPVFGKELWVDGKRKIFSLIRFQRDPQALFNFYKTSMAEVVSLAPRTPWIGVEGQFKNHEREWAQSNTSRKGYLEYKPVTLGDQFAPAPTRNVYEPPIQALSIGANMASDDMKACAGIYDAALGNRSNETSGVAIQQRASESDTANFHFLDNLQRAQRHCGRILVDLIPKIYDTAREIRILGDDMAQKVVKVNQHYQDEAGNVKHYDLSIGKFDVTASSGPSYLSRRQQAFDMLTQLSKAYPQLLQIAGDILFRNSDVPGADQLAERMAKMLPPQLQETEGQSPVPPQVQAQMQQLGQQHAQLVALVQQLKQERDAKTLELQSQEKRTAWQVQAQLVTALAKINSSDANARADREYDRLNQMFDAAHDAGLAALDQAHSQQAAEHQAAINQQQQAQQTAIQANQQQQTPQAQLPQAA